MTLASTELQALPNRRCLAIIKASKRTEELQRPSVSKTSHWFVPFVRVDPNRTRNKSQSIFQVSTTKDFCPVHPNETLKGCLRCRHLSTPPPFILVSIDLNVRQSRFLLAIVDAIRPENFKRNLAKNPKKLKLFVSVFADKTCCSQAFTELKLSFLL